MDSANDRPVAIASALVAERTGSAYPEPFASMMGGRSKRALGDVFGLRGFGVNLTELAPGARSALRHAHSHQDELVYVLDGTPTVLTDAGEHLLTPGDCVGFAAGTGKAHCLINRSEEPVRYLEIGGRDAGDRVDYPDDDLVAKFDGGRWQFAHRDGQPY